MANIQTRSSILAIKAETTEGTPVAPTAGTDAVALQPDFAMEPAFDILTNDELKSSIGAGKPILGSENPTASFSHYLRSSGVEGQAPNYGLLFKSMLGDISTASTEYNTVASSTTAIVKVDAGEGATFERGEFLLIRDGTNGYSIRAIHSISGDNLTLGFQLSTAPGTAINLGKCVLYKPGATPPTLSIWHYLGNDGAIQLVSGARVTGIDIDLTAGQLANASYSLEGIEYFFNPIVIGATNKYIDWTEDGGTEAASVEEKTYKDPHELAEALQTAMQAQSADTITVAYSNSTGKYTITLADGATLSLLWQSGTNTAASIGATLGFVVSANDTGALTYTSDAAVDFAFPYTASFDDADPVAVKNQEVLLGDSDDTTCFGASAVQISLGNSRAVIDDICEVSGRSGSLITARTVEVNVTARLSQYDVDKFYRFRTGQNTRFAYHGGVKSASNWVAGKCFGLYIPDATITAFTIEDQDGLAILNMTVAAYVDSSGNGEIYFGTL